MNYNTILTDLNCLPLIESYMTRPGLRKNAAKYISEIVDLVPQAKCIFDVGGNVGLYSCALALAYPDSVIHTFEPHPTNFQHLKQNTAHFKNITCHNVAIWDKKKTLTLSFPKNRQKENTGLYSVFFQKDELSVKVPAITLDYFAKTYKLAPEIMKIDVEGAEKQVLLGAKSLLPNMLCVAVEKCKKRPMEFPEYVEVEQILKEYFVCKIDDIDQFWTKS